MSIITVRQGALVVKAPAEIKTYVVDWDGENLGAAVTISTSVWTISALSPSTVDTALTKDSEARLTAAEATAAVLRTVVADNRVTRLRLTAGTLGQTYEVANKITTSETPNQIKERSFKILVQNT
jgi:hypothetical protein